MGKSHSAALRLKWAIPEKIQTWTPVQEQGLRAWNFEGYWRKSIWKFQGSIKKDAEFPWQGCSRKIHVEFPWVLVFDLEFPVQRVSNNFAKFPAGVEACFLSRICNSLSLVETLDSFHEFFQLYFVTFKNWCAKYKDRRPVP